MRDKLIDVAGWIAAVIFTGSLVGLLLGLGPWMLAIAVAMAVALVALTHEGMDQESEDESYGQDPGSR